MFKNLKFSTLRFSKFQCISKFLLSQRVKKKVGVLCDASEHFYIFTGDKQTEMLWRMLMDILLHKIPLVVMNNAFALKQALLGGVFH